MVETTVKIKAGSRFPALPVKDLEGNEVDISQPTGGADWTMIVVYRGRHCPICTKYLNELEAHRVALRELGVDLVAVSGDSREQLDEQRQKLDVGYRLTWGLSLEQMKMLGLYVSYPRSEKETDHPFAEPALFVVNADGLVQLVDIANAPFIRPQLDRLVSGISWIRNPDNDYPIRGTYPYEGG